MSKKQWYESLFENYGGKYDKEVFTQGTRGECDFIEVELGYNTGLRILDVGCGTGRHAIELTKRGYNVTGIDLSESQLARAREKAAAEGLKIDFQQQDARNLAFEKIEIFGATLGAYARTDKLTTEHFEMLVIARKYGEKQK